MKQGSDQIALPLDWPQTEGDARFIVTDANREAFDHFRKFSMWPVKATILTGPRRSGRTLLARSFVERVGGRLFDEADQRDEEELFHAWNQAQDSGRPLVMVADQAPPAWAPRLPDLKTRLAVTPVATINHPDDALFASLIRLHFADRGLHIPLMRCASWLRGCIAIIGPWNGRLRRWTATQLPSVRGCRCRRSDGP